jgi:predicted CoA-binding protein
MMLKQKKWAVVGATPNTEKFGNKIFKKLKAHGYEVYPVNPMYKEIEGDTCYETLADLPEKVECVNIVVAPERAKRALEDVIALKIENIWFQPGTFTPELIDASETAGLNTVFYNCVLVELDKK